MRKRCIMGGISLLIFVLVFGRVTAEGKAYLLQDFEKEDSTLRVSEDRGCKFALSTNSNFVVSGSKAARFKVINHNINQKGPPFFKFSPPISDWSDYQSLSFYLSAISVENEAGIFVQLQSKGGKVLWQRIFSVPTNKHLLVKIPLNQILFRETVGKILLGAASAAGVYYIDKVELSTTTVGKVMVETLASKEITSEYFDVNLRDVHNIYEVGELLKTSIIFSSKNPVSMRKEVKIYCCLLDKQGNTINQKEVIAILEKGAKERILPVILWRLEREGDYTLRANLGNETKMKKTIRVRRGISAISRENVKIKRKQRENNPFYGTISTYADKLRRKDGHVDTERTIKMLRDLGANTHTFFISYRDTDWEDLHEFLPAALRAGIRVWIYIIPPLEKKMYPPFGTDYLRWSEEIAKLSLKYPNLTHWLIDDVSWHLDFFTLEYLTQIYEKSKSINPKLAFGVCVYYPKIKKFMKMGYGACVDSVMWGYRSEYTEFGGISSKELPLEINHYYKTCPDKVIFPCIYVGRHSSWQKNLPTLRYLEETLNISYEQTGIAWLYCLPLDPENQKYKLAKRLISKWRRSLSK